MEDDLRLADGDLVALAAHGFDEHGEVEDAAAGDGEQLRAGDRLGAQGDVLLQFPLKPLAEVPAGEVSPFLSGQRRGVHAEGHLQRRLVDDQARQRPGRLRIADRVADFHVFQSHQGDDVAGGAHLDVDAAEVLEDLDGDDPRRACLAVLLHHRHVLPGPDLAGIDASDGDSPDVVRPVERRDQHLQRGAASISGPGIFSRIRSISGVIVPEVAAGSCEAKPSFALVKM